MNPDQVHAVLGKPSSVGPPTGFPEHYYERPPGDTQDVYFDAEDAFGNKIDIRVYYLDGKVVGWKVKPTNAPPPPLLTRIKKVLGW
jgi:hypothetical protein